MLILRDLIPGTKRFGELKKSIGNVSQKVLTAQLRQMEDSGLLTRTVYPEVPPRVEYTLTDLGRSLKPILLSAAGVFSRSLQAVSFFAPGSICTGFFAMGHRDERRQHSGCMDGRGQKKRRHAAAHMCWGT